MFVEKDHFKSAVRRFAVSSLIALTTGVCLAGAGDSVNVFGALEVHSKSTNTIVSVPWVNLGPGEERPIRACDLVMTNNLSLGDTILVYNLDKRSIDQQYTGWVLSKTGWESITTVSTDGLSVAPEAELALVNRGKAFWLRRSHPMQGSEAVPFYLCGQYTASAAESVDIDPGSRELPIYHFLASPAGEDKCINDFDWKPYAVNDNDTISVPLNDVKGAFRIYFYDRSVGKWYYKMPNKNARNYNGIINAGTGFWYISRGGRMTVKW